MPEIPATTEELYRQYDEGYSLTQIAVKYNVTRQATHDRFQRAGLPRRNGGGDHRRRPKIIIDVQEFEQPRPKQIRDRTKNGCLS